MLSAKCSPGDSLTSLKEDLSHSCPLLFAGVEAAGGEEEALSRGGKGG